MNRDPHGHFMGRDSALFHWLPLMLGWTHGDQLATMLERAAHWCTKQAAAEMILNGEYIQKNPDERTWWMRPLQRMEAWRLRREVLFEAIEKLKAIK